MRNHGDSPGTSSALWADALTLARFPLAAIIVWLLSADRSVDAGLVLVLGWASDAADGRLARRADGHTRFGHLDLPADASLGLAVLTGLLFAGDLPTATTLAGSAAFIGLAWLLRNPAPLLLLMGGAYARLLWLLFQDDGPARWAVLVAPIVFLILEGRRLFGVVIPAFLNAAGALLRGRRPERMRSIDEWRHG
jgi:hypothetical protein